MKSLLSLLFLLDANAFEPFMTEKPEVLIQNNVHDDLDLVFGFASKVKIQKQGVFIRCEHYFRKQKQSIIIDADFALYNVNKILLLQCESICFLFAFASYVSTVIK